MSFIPKNPISTPVISENPPSPPTGARGLFAKDDGWYDIDVNGNIKKIGITSYNDLTDKPFSNVNWLDIDSLYGREKDGIYKVSGKEMSGNVGMGTSSSYMLVMTNVSGNVLQTCQYLIHSDGKSQYRLGTGTGIEDWSEWESVGTTSYNDLTDKPNLSAVATSGSYNDLKDTPPVTLLSLEGSPIWSPSLLDDLDEGVYLYSSDGDYTTRGADSSAIVIVACVNEKFVDMPDGNRNKIYIFKQVIYSGFGIRVREKATSLSGFDYGTYDWREVPLNDSLATKAYVDSAIGDALEGVY